MPVYPTNLPIGTVHGRFAFLTADTTADADAKPDLLPVIGQVRLRCSATPPVKFQHTPGQFIGLVVREFVLQFNADGDLADSTGRTVFNLLATNSALLNPTDFQWEAIFELVMAGTNEKINLPSFRFVVPENGDVDLAAVMPVTASNGVAMIAGPPNSLVVGTVMTGDPGTSVIATITGTAPNQTLNLTIPRGSDGSASAGVASVNTRTGAVTLTSTDVGLGNVNNTSDAAKPISTATQTALDGKAASTHNHTASQISDASTVGRSVVTAVDAAAARTAIGAGTSSLVLGATGTTAMAGNRTFTKADVGLGSVDNTSDLAKPVSTATQAALDAKAPITHTHTAANITDFQEAAQDAIALLLQSGTGIGVAYDDVLNKLTITNTGGGAGSTDPEVVRDTIGAALAGIGLITVTANDALDTITIATTATANSTDATLLARANHTGEQAISTVTGLQTALDGKAAVSHTHTASQISDSTATGRSVLVATDAATARTAIGAGTSSLVIGTTASTAKAGNYAPTATDVGLGNVNNTSDAAKPISTLTQTALDGKAAATHTHTASQISDASTIGRTVLTAVDAPAVRTALSVPAKLNVPFTVKWLGTAWEYATLATATAAGLDAAQIAWFVGNPGGAVATWARAGDVWTQG